MDTTPEITREQILPRSPRTILRIWIEEHLEGRDEVSMADLLPEARAHFSTDEEFREAIVTYGFLEAFEDAWRRAMSANRQFAQRGRVAITEEEINRLVREKFAKWWEVATGNVRVPLLKMNREQLAYTCERRNRQIEGQMAALGFLQTLRTGLPDDDTTVGDHYTGEQLVELYLRYYDR